MAGIKTPIRIMNKSDRKFAIAAMLCGIATALVSCYYEAGEIETTEQEVVFSAATQYENLPETRTIYSGQYFDISGNHRERIDWVAGTDKIKILNGNTGDVATYTVGTPSASNERSVADVTADASRLTWSTDGNPNTFYAVYPSTASVVAASHTFSGTIVADQSAQTESHTGVTLPGSTTGGTYTNPVMSEQAFMVAKVQASSGSNVTLPFYPAMTAFEFNVVIANDGGTDATITSFDMSSTHDALTGSWSWDGSTFTCPARSAGNNDKITVNFTGGRTISASNPLKFTVFALPQNLTEVKLTFHLTSGDKTLSLKTGGVWDTFQACKKYRITTPGLPTDGEWIYIIEEIDDIVKYGHLAVSSDVDVVSYRVRRVNGVIDPTTYQAVAWKSQYWDGSAWQDWSSAYGDFSLGSSYIGNGVSDITTSEPRTISLVDNANYTSTGYQTSTQILRGRTPVTNYSLCDHDLYGNSINSSTANTYVISTSGSYTFPCVYGNAIEDGQINSAAYSGGHFRNAVNAGITNCWINTDLTNGHGLRVENVSAEVVWQDEQIISTQPTARFVGGNYWIDFTINQSEIRPGNVVIALKGTVKQSSGNVLLNNAILWSWQIWVTDQDLTTVNGFMPFNLGWDVDGEAQIIQYTNRTLPIRIQQIIPADDLNAAVDYEDFTFTQLADAARTYELAIGSNPYYQWGRKDPMIPGLYSPVPNERGDYCMDKPFYPGANYASMSSLTQDPGSSLNYVEYGKGVRNPHIAYRNDWTTGWIGGNHNLVTDPEALPYNLWDANIQTANASGTGESGANKIKTVYDPCPYGFTVPYQSKFTSFVQSGNNGATDGGRYFNNLFFPYSGARIFYNRIAWGEYSAENPGPAIPAALYLRHINEYGLYWTDTPYSDVRYARMLLFVSSNVVVQQYLKGGAASIRPMVDPRHPPLTPPASYPPQSNVQSLSGGSAIIQPIGSGGEIPSN